MEKLGSMNYPPPPPRGENDEFLSSPDSPEKHRRAFTKSEKGSDETAVQVETKPGLAWAEPEPSAPAGRERKVRKAPVDAEPLVQVETKTEAELGLELLPKMFGAGTRKVSATQGLEEQVAQLERSEGKPLSQILEEYKPQTSEELRQKQAARIAALKPSGAAPDAPTIKMFVEANKADDKRSQEFRDAEAKENKEIDERIVAERAIEVGKDPEVEPMPAVFRRNREPQEVVPAVEGVPVLEEVVDTEKPTAGESHTLLGKLISGYKRTLEAAKEKFKKAREFLTNEDKTLGEKAKAFGKGTGELLVNTGEWYRKQPLKYKIALSAALIGGSIATGGSGTFVTLLSAAKLGQRSAASLGVYTLVNGLMEKRLASKEEQGYERDELDSYLKHVTAASAALLTFTGVPGFLAKEGFEAAEGGRLIAWLGSMWPFDSSSVSEATKWTKPPGVPAETPVDKASVGHTTTDTPNPAPKVAPMAPDREVATAAPDIKAPATASETSTGNLEQQDVEKIKEALGKTERDLSEAKAGIPALIEARDAAAAAAGEAAQTAAVAPEMLSVKATPGKGAEYMMKRLWEQLHERGVALPDDVKPDSDLARLLAVEPGDEARINKLVHDLAGDTRHNFYHADGTSFRVDKGMEMTFGARGELHISDAGHDFTIAPAHWPTTAPYHPEASATVADSGIVEKVVPVETPAPTDSDSTSGQDTVPSPNEIAPGVIASAEQAGVIQNQFGLAIKISEPHIYESGAAGMVVFGSVAAERAKAVQAYLVKNPNSVVFGADATGVYRVPFHLVEGKVVEGPRMKSKGLFGLLSAWMKPPAPDELSKIIT